MSQGQGSAVGHRPVRCALAPKCPAEASGKHVKGWFHMKDGTSFCPDHIPEWVEKWRKYKLSRQMTRLERSQSQRKLGDLVCELNTLHSQIDSQGTTRREFRDELLTVIEHIGQLRAYVAGGGDW